MVKCSICHTEGHNKRSCPSQKTTDKDADVVPKVADDAAPDAEKPVKEKKTKVKKEKKFEVKITEDYGGVIHDIATFGYSNINNIKKGIQSLKRRMAKLSDNEEIADELTSSEDGPKNFDELADALIQRDVGSKIEVGSFVFQIVAV